MKVFLKKPSCLALAKPTSYPLTKKEKLKEKEKRFSPSLLPIRAIDY